MVRRPDWPERLAELLAERADAPFDWASNNCGLFAADCILAMTGTDLGKDFRGRCTSQSDAVLAIREQAENLETLAANIMAAHDLKEIPALTAQRGDLVYVERDGRPSLGIAHGSTAWFASPEGLVKIPLRAARRAWRIA